MAADAPSIHASAVLIGAKAALIRGGAGSGKSRLVLSLLQAAQQGALPFARLVADDRAFLETAGGRLLVRPAPALAGKIEIRGLGIRTVEFEPVAAVGLVVDLAAEDGGRMPPEDAHEVILAGIRLPRLAVAPGMDGQALVLACLRIGSSPI